MAQDTSYTFIQGVTSSGRKFRPSDWAERLAGVMSQFKPEGLDNGPERRICYSAWCLPTMVGDIKCVVVCSDLQTRFPAAWDFVMNFAHDNDLQISDACYVPELADIKR